MRRESIAGRLQGPLSQGAAVYKPPWAIWKSPLLDAREAELTKTARDPATAAISVPPFNPYSLRASRRFVQSVPTKKLLTGGSAYPGHIVP